MTKNHESFRKTAVFTIKSSDNLKPFAICLITIAKVDKFAKRKVWF